MRFSPDTSRRRDGTGRRNEREKNIIKLKRDTTTTVAAAPRSEQSSVSLFDQRRDFDQSRPADCDIDTRESEFKEIGSEILYVI